MEKVLNNVVQIYNPADINAVPPQVDRPHRCISGGRLVPQKNYGDMLKVWSSVSKDFPDWRLDIYGTGHSEAAFPPWREISASGTASWSTIRQEISARSLKAVPSI